MKNDLKACQQCHSESPKQLRSKIFAIQDRTMSGFIRSGYATASVAKLFEMANKARTAGIQVDQDLYSQAGASNQELIIAAVIAAKTVKPARLIYLEVKNGSKTWGILLQEARIDTKTCSARFPVPLK